MPAPFSALACIFCRQPLDLRAKRCRGCGGPIGLTDIAMQVRAALSGNGTVPASDLAAHCQVGEARIVAALDELEAAGVRMHRTDKGVELDEVAAEAARPHVTGLGTLLVNDWPSNPIVRGASSIAGLPARKVPGQPAFLAKRIQRRSDAVSLDRVAARLAELGVFPASHRTGCSS